MAPVACVRGLRGVGGAVLLLLAGANVFALHKNGRGNRGALAPPRVNQPALSGGASVCMGVCRPPPPFSWLAVAVHTLIL
jgi:hypothetical protein